MDNSLFYKNLNMINEGRFKARCIDCKGLRRPAKLLRSETGKTLLVSGMHLASLFNSEKEAEIQASLIPENSTKANIYGIGIGELPRILLKRKALKRLNLYILNLSVFKEVLRNFDLTDWLDDSRVNLVIPDAADKVNSPFCVIFPCMLLAPDNLAPLRDRLLLELNSPFLNRYVREEIVAWKSRLIENYPFFEQDGDVADLFDSWQGCQVAVIGGGPTLASGYGYLKKNRKNLKIVTVNTALKSLVNQGIIPDAVVVIDPGIQMPRYFETDLKQLKGSLLVYFPGVISKVLNLWPGKRFMAYSEKNTENLKSVYELYPRGRLYSAGSTIHPATDLAVKMGALKILFFGTDFSYPGGRTHVQGAVYEEKVQTDDTFQNWVVDGSGQKIPSKPGLIGFLRDLEDYIHVHSGVEFLNSSRLGARIVGTEYLNLEQPI